MHEKGTRKEHESRNIAKQQKKEGKKAPKIIPHVKYEEA